MDESQVIVKFGGHLKKLRLKKNISQEKLAFLCGLHPTYISHLETGKKQPTLSTLISLAKSLEVKISELLSPFE